jgi:4,5-DOPA dioxygenase extradiol
MRSERLPVAFVGHGSPMNTLETNQWTEAWRAWAATLPPVRAVLAVSAHWYVGATAVTAMARPRTIHDFGGFPDELFAYQYPAPGDPALARQVADLLAPTPVVLDESEWGLDHGTWSVLAHVFPDADVPVVQIAIDATQPPQFHLDLGRRLAPLREDGVLVLGSGNIVHNLRMAYWAEVMDPSAPKRPPYDWAVRADAEVRAALAAADDAALAAFPRRADGLLAHPSPDHYLPLLYVEGARHPDDEVHEFVTGLEAGSLSMLSVALA